MVQRGGRFSGEAYVLLGSAMQLEMAVQKNRQHIGKRYVEVFPCRKLVRPLHTLHRPRSKAVCPPSPLLPTFVSGRPEALHWSYCR